MATASQGQVSTTGAEQNRCHLFRLQMLIIDGGLDVLRNIFDKKLQNISLSLSTFLQQKRLKITILRSKGIIAQVQYDLLYPPGGSGPSITDLDITLITCLLRNFKLFGLNKNFQWNSNPAQYDTSMEADMSRLKMYRNQLCHISSTSEITPNVFTSKWTEIEQVLLRLNTTVSPIPDLKKTIDDFEVSPLDPETERRVQKAVDSWQMLEKGMEAELKLIKEDTKDIKLSVESQAQSIDELNKKTFDHDEQIHELKLKEESRKDADVTAERESMTPSQYEELKKTLKDNLITWYNANQSNVPLSPLTDDPHTPLPGFYIMPEFDMHTNLLSGRKETTRVKSIPDLFKSERRGQLKIYLSAVAGFGKTAFSKYLAITWCQAHKMDDNYKHFKEEELEALSVFEFLFLVLLRDTALVCDVDDMIEQQVIQYLPCSSSMPKGLLKDILGHEKCLIILDGLDEWSHPANNCTKVPKSIPHQYEREKCVILTTTRPWKLGVSDLNTNQIHKTVELVQLKKDDVRQFSLNAMKILKDNTEKDELCAFEEKIRNHGLEDMKKTPLLLLYLICLWVYKFPIGKTAVEIYTGIIELLLSRTATLHGKLFHSSCEISPSYVPECFKKHTHCSSYSAFLLKIGKLAFYTLFSKITEHTLVFDKNIAEKYLNPEDLKSSCQAGILSESKTKTLIDKTFKISFSHKTVQEYFSAIFISFQNTNEVQKTIFEGCNCLQNILNMSKLFGFISNMNPKLMSTISRDLMPAINNDEKTRKYRTMADINDMPLLKEIQNMYISYAMETKENIDFKLCLQDIKIDHNAKCQELQHLCQQNKENIKSIMIQNVAKYSLQEITNLFAISDLPRIEKLNFMGEIKEEEVMSLLFNTLKCLTMRSCKYGNSAFHCNYCRLSAEINDRLVNLQHLECLYITYFTMTHETMETLLNFLTSKTSMKEIILYHLKCTYHDTGDTSCRFNLDFSQHLHLRYLGLTRIPVSQINMDASLLEQCTVGELHKPGDASSYLSRLPAASKLHTLMCESITSSRDIDTMLETLPLLHHLKEVWLYGINLGERPLKLSPQMSNIELVALYWTTMSCSKLHDFYTDYLITVVNKLPQTVTVCMVGCNIKPDTEFENFKTEIKHSNIFVVISDSTHSFKFKTIKTTE